MAAMRLTGKAPRWLVVTYGLVSMLLALIGISSASTAVTAARGILPGMAIVRFAAPAGVCLLSAAWLVVLAYLMFKAPEVQVLIDEGQVSISDRRGRLLPLPLAELTGMRAMDYGGLLRPPVVRLLTTRGAVRVPGYLRERDVATLLEVIAAIPGMRKVAQDWKGDYWEREVGSPAQ